MVKPKYVFTVSISEDEFKMKEKLRELGYSAPKTWRHGAEHLLKKHDKVKPGATS